MLTTFEIDDNFRKMKWDSDDMRRFQNYARYRELYRSEFARPFRGVLNKLLRRYPLQNTTAQTLIEVNLFKSLTDFFKFLTTNSDFKIIVDSQNQELWDNIAYKNNFLSVLKEVCVDNSRFGDALFKVALSGDEVKIFSVCPDCWFPVFENGNLNELSGHMLLFDTIHNGRLFKHIEKIHKGFIENEIWEVSNTGILTNRISNVEDFGLLPIDDFSDKWDDFVLFPVKNTTESDTFYGESDYKSCESIVEEIMLTISQNSKIINRHANPKLAGSIENTELNPITGERHFPNSDFITMGKDGQKPEYITADLQSDAIKTHIDTLMQFFYILTKTPPQAYGIDISANMSGESLKTILSTSLAKVQDIRAVSLTNAIVKVVECALAFAGGKNSTIKVDWNPEDESQSTKSNVIKLTEQR